MSPDLSLQFVNTANTVKKQKEVCLNCYDYR